MDNKKKCNIKLYKGPEYICNPQSGRWVIATGNVGKSLISLYGIDVLRGYSKSLLERSSSMPAISSSSSSSSKSLSKKRTDKSIYGKACNSDNSNEIKLIANIAKISYVDDHTTCLELDKYLSSIPKLAHCEDNISYLTQEKMGDIHPIDIIAYEDNGITSCFTVEEILEMQEREDRTNPYTRKKIPQKIFDEANIRQYFIEKEEQQIVKKVKTSAQKINDLLTNKFNYSGNYIKVANMTVKQMDEFILQYTEISEVFSKNRLSVLKPKPLERLVYILETVPTDSIVSANEYLDEISKDNNGTKLEENRTQLTETMLEELGLEYYDENSEVDSDLDINWTRILDYIKRGANVHSEADYVLTVAVYYNRLDVVKELIETLGYTFNLNSPFSDYLGIAVMNGNMDMLDYLLEKGANINRTDLFIRNDQLNIIEHLVDSGYNIHRDNDSALALAMQRSQVDAVRYLISKGADPLANDGYMLSYSATKLPVNVLDEIYGDFIKNKSEISKVAVNDALLNIIQYGGEDKLDLLKYFVKNGVDYKQHANLAIQTAIKYKYDVLFEYWISIMNPSKDELNKVLDLVASVKSRDYIKICSILIRAGADVNKISKQSMNFLRENGLLSIQ